MRAKKEVKQSLQNRVKNIETFIRFANECYRDYERKSAIGYDFSSQELKALITKIEYFNKTQYEDKQVGRFDYDQVPVYYFEGFKTAYPKQYKQIVKDMAKEKIAPEYLVAQLPVLSEKLEKVIEAENKEKNKENAKKILKEKTQELAKIQDKDLAA